MRPLLGPITRRTLVSKVRICDQLKHEKDELIVWWYGGIVKNYRAESVPWVIVFFRKLDENGNLGVFVSRKVALTFLGLLRIGTIWKNGECKSEVSMSVEQKKIDADFSHGVWKFVSPMQAAGHGIENPINQDDYPLPFPFDKNWLVDFPLPNGKNLLIPCTEFFVRYYGRSEEVPRVLATYGWDEVNKRFYAPFNQPVMPNSWPVKLKSRMYNSDVVFLAHMKHDQYTALAAKSINSQIEISFSNKEPCAFIQAGPWFEGKAQVSVSGLWINNGKTFLALRILGGSDPQEAPIQRDRENNNKADGTAGTELGNPTDGRSPRVHRKPPKIVDLTDDDEPDHGAPTVEVEEPDFVILGEPRVVIDVKRNRAKTKTVTMLGEGEKPKSYSSGDPHGSGKGVGNASIHARTVMESQGTLRDMWNAMRLLKKKHPKLVNSVEWFTFESGFSSEVEPKMIGLKPFDEDNEVTTELRNWLFYDVYSKDPRGILVARLVVAGISIYFIEIERRPRTKKDNDGNPVDTEESFMGFVLVLDDQSQFESWLGNFLSGIRHVKGIVQKLVASSPGKAAVFKHSTAKDDVVPCETAVLSALKKVEVEVC